MTDVEQLTAWLERIEHAAGMGRLADIAAHQRALGVEGDHETRLRHRRVAELVDLVTEAAAHRADAYTPTPHFAARTRGTCARCHEIVEPGEPVNFWDDDDNIAHVHCPEATP